MLSGKGEAGMPVSNDVVQYIYNMYADGIYCTVRRRARSADGLVKKSVLKDQ